ncbi:FMN-binding negative transcriptional regulator [bacterium]|nr:FMN-binding negative transcriptional regulator [bacterium]
MYTPSAFAVSDRNKLHDFIEAHSFATLVSSDGDSVGASHLPLLLNRNVGKHGQLVGHFAKANPHWKILDGSSVLAIFHGPHAYVSPAWYGEQNVVPTWNYVAVHARGILRLEQDHGRLLDIVRQSVEVYETPQPTPWQLDSVEPAFIDNLLNAIVGFTIDIEQLEGKWKLNQNHSVERQQRVIAGLRTRPDTASQQIADLMERIV